MSIEWNSVDFTEYFSFVSITSANTNLLDSDHLLIEFPVHNFFLIFHYDNLETFFLKSDAVKSLSL